jgi:hypothetical protein
MGSITAAMGAIGLLRSERVAGERIGRAFSLGFLSRRFPGVSAKEFRQRKVRRRVVLSRPPPARQNPHVRKKGILL